MNRTFCRVSAGTALLLVAAHGQALAQRAVQAPSASVASPSAAPEGMEGALVWGGDLTSHLQGELTKSSDTSAKGTAFDDTDSNFYANYSTWLSVYGNLHLERNRDDNEDDYFPGSNTFFRSEGLTLRQLFAALRPADDLTVYGGKIHPNFGSAFANEPGNFYNFASDYEETERLGVGAEYRLPAVLGVENARLSVEVFKLDTTPLSISLLSQPSLSDLLAGTADRAGRYTPAQFGPSNTGSLDSYTVALRGGRPETGLTYQLSYEAQATAAPAGKTEHGGSLGLMYDPGGGDGLSLGHRLGVIPFAEYAQFDNFGGTAGQREDYLIGGLAFHYVRWELDVAGGLRKGADVPLADGATGGAFDRQENASLNYTVIPYYLTAGIGINHINVAGKGSSWSGGPSLTYTMTF